MRGIYILWVTLLMSCSPTESEVAISYEQNGPLKHIVLLDLKDGCSDDDIHRVVTALYTLQDIDEVIDLEVSHYIDTGDDRLIAGYDILLYTEFGDKEDLAKYSTDQFHLSVREELKPYLASKPKVLDSFEY